MCANMCVYVYKGQGTKGSGTMKQLLYGPLGQQPKQQVAVYQNYYNKTAKAQHDHDMFAFS